MKHVPKLKTDAEAEAFLQKDLSGLDFSQFKPTRFEFQAKDAQINMRLPSKLLAAVKARAKSSGIPYQRFIRETLEQAVGKKAGVIYDAFYYGELLIISGVRGA